MYFSFIFHEIFTVAIETELKTKKKKKMTSTYCMLPFRGFT